MLTIYGSMLCKDCVACRADLDRAGVSYEFRDFAEKLSYLKEFLALRDENPVFETVRIEGKIGIPCICRADGTVTLDWREWISM